MESVKKVPWTDWDEWLGCWKSLQESPQESLKILEIWSIRESLPVRIECTRIILNCVYELTSTVSLDSLNSLKGEVPKLSLSMVVTRCVNMIIDLYNDTKYARSVSATAKSIMLPEFLVDLRHDATHGTLPDMFLLIKAVHELLDWLYKEYWGKQCEYLIENHEKVIREIDRFYKRSLVTTEDHILVKFAEGLFKAKIECFREKIGRIVADLRLKMSDGPWAIIFLQLQSKNRRFAESVFQGWLYMLKLEKISIGQMKCFFEEVNTLAPEMAVSYSPWVKNLILLQNSDVQAFELVKKMNSAGVFMENVAVAVTKASEISIFSEKKTEVVEISDLPMKKWRKLATWSTRALGSNS